MLLILFFRNKTCTLKEYECIVVNQLLITQTKTKQTNPIPRSDES